MKKSAYASRMRSTYFEGNAYLFHQAIVRERINMEEIRIRQITDPDDPAIISMQEWLMGWWGVEQGYNRAKMQSYLQHSLCKDRLPETFALYYNGVLAGMFQLSMTDIDVRPDIYPWLINIYIVPPFRGRGLLNEIMESARMNAAALGFRELYLFTRHKSLYERYDWKLIETFRTFITEDDVQQLYKLEIR